MASGFGYNTLNATLALTSVIQSSFDTIIVDKQLSDWNIDPITLFNLQNKTIIIEDSVIIKALPGAFNGLGDCLFNFYFANNVNIIGYGATLAMNKAEYVVLNNSEYRHGLSFSNCSNITIKGLKIIDTGGDGIYIGGEIFSSSLITYCENVFIEDVSCINNYRQGMSITSVQNLKVKNCLFAETKGTLPEAGLDIEPYLTYQRITNVSFDKCVFKNNYWAGVSVALLYMDTSSLPVDITFNNCLIENNRDTSNNYAACEIFISAKDSFSVQGNLTFNKYIVNNSKWTALYSRKTSDAFSTTFNDCVFYNVSQEQILYNNPIFLEVPSYSSPSSYLGGFNFNNMLISFKSTFDFFRVFGWSTLQGIKDIAGNFTVVSPNVSGINYQQVQDTVNVKITDSNYTVLPLNTIEINNNLNLLEECTTNYSVLNFSRSSVKIDYPLPIFYTTNGNAILGNDVHLITNAIIIASNETSALDSVVARNDNVLETIDSLNIFLKVDSLYSLGTLNTANILINDCSIIQKSKVFNTSKACSLFMYNNIATLTGTNLSSIIIYDVSGKNVFFTSFNNVNNIQLDLTKLKMGIYFAKVKVNNSIQNFKLIVI